MHAVPDTVSAGSPDPALTPAALPAATMRRVRTDTVRLAALLPVFLALIAWLPPVYTRGEAREGLVVRELVAGGDWIAPRREGVLASKPPLFHWIAAGTAQLVGTSDFALRVPTALGAWGMVVATFALGLTLFDRRRAWLAVGVLLATGGFWPPALQARVDMLFAAAVTVALAGFASWRLTDRPRGRHVLYLACAAAVLTKGPIGAILPAIVIVITHMGMRDGARLRDLWAPGPACAATALVMGWYGLAYHRAGREFLAVHVLHENLDRALGWGTFAHRGRDHSLKLVATFVTWLAPWNAAALATWRRPHSRQRWFLHAWWIVTLALFSAAVGKRSVYLLPLYPAIALLAADWLDGRVVRRRRLAVALGVVATILAAGTVAVARWDEARSPLHAFADAVHAAVPPAASLGARAVDENDRLVLAYRLGRPLPRLDRAAVNPSFVLAPRTEHGARVRACDARVSWPEDDGGLVLLACPLGSGGEQRR